MQIWNSKSFQFPNIFEYFKAFIHLFYPHICLQCGTDELADQHILCEYCESQLPYTNFSLIENSPVEKMFWGRAKINTVISILFFTKDSIVQKIIFELKYKQNKKAGYLLGKLIAYEITNSNKFDKIDFLIPIPISKKRERNRGFNQAKIICEAIVANGFKVSIFNGLVKQKDTATQTHKGRLQRSNYSESLFYLNDPNCLQNKHLLIVDDVLTTGATIEAVYQCLCVANPASIHLATAAYTLH